jgi:hypothetical protein
MKTRKTTKASKTTKAEKKHMPWTRAQDKKLLRLWSQVKRGDNEHKERIAAHLGRTKASCAQRVSMLRKQERTATAVPQRTAARQETAVPQQKKEAQQYQLTEPVVAFIEMHMDTTTKEREQRLVIEDTIEKLDILLARLRKVLE